MNKKDQLIAGLKRELDLLQSKQELARLIIENLESSELEWPEGQPMMTAADFAGLVRYSLQFLNGWEFVN